MTDLFTPGSFVSHSGITLPFKIDCDALSDVDLDTLARWYGDEMRRKNQVYGEIVGVPRGGLRFAEALNRHVATNGNSWQTNLVVDDVLTTGRSMRECWEAHWPMRASGVRGLVIFARGPCPDWVRPIFSMVMT